MEMGADMLAPHAITDHNLLEATWLQTKAFGSPPPFGNYLKIVVRQKISGPE